MEDFIKDRNEAFMSGDEEKVKAYCKKYKITIPENETVFKAGIHKVICTLYLSENSSITKEQYEKSYNWLIKNGYSPSIIGGEE